MTSLTQDTGRHCTPDLRIFGNNGFAAVRTSYYRPGRRCDTLCTSSFMDDVTFGRSGLYGDAWKAEPYNLLPLAALRYRDQSMWAERERQNFRSPLTYFFDSRSPLRSPLRDLPLPLQPTFFTPAHRSAPAHQIFGPLRSISAPLLLQ